MVDEGSFRQKRLIITNAADVFTITIRRRSWRFWTVASLYFPIEALLLQTALASVRESESRAALISGIAAALLACVGVFAWQYRGKTFARGESNGKP